MSKWDWKTDILSAWKPITAFLCYLCLISFSSRYFDFFYTTATWHDETPSIYTRSYFYLQLIVCIFIAFIVSAIFGECFRKSSHSFFQSLAIGRLKIIFFRYICLLLLILLAYLPVVAISFVKVNENIVQYIGEVQNTFGNTPFPLINIFVPLVQCAIAISFYVTATLFLLMITKHAIAPPVILMAYCALEAGPLRSVFFDYAIFTGSFSSQNFYAFFPPNIKVLIILTPILLILVLLFYDSRWILYLKTRG